MAGFGFSREFVNRVREANDLRAVAEGYGLVFRARGRNAMALCPFHQEKTPSFSVRAEEGYYHCFGCGAGGDVYQFVMLMERVEFPEAVEMLAERAGLPVVREQLTPAAAGELSQAKERKLFLFRLNRAVMGWFEKNLWESELPEAARAREYLKRRGIEEETARGFHLGLARDSWDALSREFGGSATKERMLVAAGLARSRDGAGSGAEAPPPSGPGALGEAGAGGTGSGGGAREGRGIYDLFRGRLIFPILDEQGRTTGFGGRVLDASEPKYLNSPETAAFSKGRLLYGLDRAREALRREGAPALVMEGYTDVILAHQHGFTTAVAPLGTALGREHVQLLRRRADAILLVFDGDAAGLRAAERANLLFLEGEAPARIVLLPEEQDPADLLVAGGAAALDACLARPREPLDFLIERVAAGRDLARDAERAAVVKEVLELVARIPDPVLRSLARRRLAERLDVDERSFEEVSRQLPRRVGPVGTGTAGGAAGADGAPGGLGERPALSRRERAERELAGLLLNWPALIAEAAAAGAGAPHEPRLARLLEAAQALDAQGEYSPRALLDALAEPEERALATELFEAGRELCERDQPDRPRDARELLPGLVRDAGLFRQAEELEALQREAKAARAAGRAAEAEECDRRILAARAELLRRQREPREGP